MRLFFLSLFFSTSLSALELPKNCEMTHVNFKNNRVYLHTQMTDETDLYFLHNFQKIDIFLNHQKRHPSASAGWGSKLSKKNWSAILVSQPNFSLLCTNKKWQAINCKKVLTVCRIRHFVDQGKNQGGTYWLSENLSYKKITQQLLKRKLFLNPLSN